MSLHSGNNDPLDFVKNMWGNMGFSLPGMVTPTLDTDELQKQITDLKAVEGWLRMNLSMLQMTIQSMEMQHSTLTAVKAMGAMATKHSNDLSQDSSGTAEAAGAAAEAAASAFSQAALWPWNMMNQVQEHLQQQSAAAPEPAPEPKPRAARSTKTTPGKAKKPATGTAPRSRKTAK